jgi:ADP-heptose:LPS heptosyltransferase
VQKIILKNFQSPGDIVMLTAAVRDLNLAHPGRFVIDVRTACDGLWANNPHLTRLSDDDEEATQIHCDYPLIHHSNDRPVHFIRGFIEDLGEKLGVSVTPTAFKGDIHLAPQEKLWISQVQEITRIEVPFWIIVAGGKEDYTIKWWDPARWQDVVDHFRGRILFVQVGEAQHIHSALDGVLDFRGRTDLRQLVRLVYHSQGVVCPVTLLMHLAAAVEVKGRQPKNRPCVVVAGGREPAQWEAYPHHQSTRTAPSYAATTVAAGRAGPLRWGIRTRRTSVCASMWWTLGAESGGQGSPGASIEMAGAAATCRAAWT